MTEIRTTQFQNFPDLHCIISAIFEKNSRVDFVIYEIERWEASRDGENNWKPIYPDGAMFPEDFTPYLHGFVRFDGCSNWHFDKQERGTMLHACSRIELQRFSDMMIACWDWANTLLGIED